MNTIIAVTLWMLVGTFAGVALAPLFGVTESWKTLAAIFAVAVGATGLVPGFQGRIGIPMVSLLGALAGWAIGFASDIWQVGALGVISGASGGAYWGLRLQDRFTRNTERGTQGTQDFYR